jgi:hypothetical protein
MTVYLDRRRFMVDGRRYTGYCVDADGKQVASKRLAEEAEGVAKRDARNSRGPAATIDITFAEALASLEPD